MPPAICPPCYIITPAIYPPAIYPPCYIPPPVRRRYDDMGRRSHMETTVQQPLPLSLKRGGDSHERRQGYGGESAKVGERSLVEASQYGVAYNSISEDHL